MPVTSAAAMVAGCGGGGVVLRSPGFTASVCTCSRSLPCFVSSGNVRPNLSNRRNLFPLKLYPTPKLGLLPRAADSTQSSSIATATADKPTVPDDEFSLAKVSFGVIGLGVGVSLLSYGFGAICATISLQTLKQGSLTSFCASKCPNGSYANGFYWYGFGAYFNILPGSEWSAIMLTYGFPLAIIGMALKYAELKPVPCLTYSDALALREKCATPILQQVRSDVTRYRYGDEQHLDEALKRIFQYGQGGGIPRRSAPILQSIREEVTEDGRYALVLIFEAKALELSDFEQRKAKFTSFFGPGITAEIAEGGKDAYEVKLISNTTL